jgi:hypothetical protein
MDSFLIDTIIEKVELSEKRLDESEKQLSGINQRLISVSDQSENFKQLSILVKRLQDSMKEVKWPVNEINQMSFHLKLNNNLLANPKKTKRIVIHTFGSLAWVISGLSIVLLLLTVWVFNLNGKIDQYKTNDLLWRYIKVTNGGQNLKYLQSIEKRYLDDPKVIRSFIEQEEFKQKQIAESFAADQSQNQLDSVSSSVKRKKKKKLEADN